jgi:hypothetical protein
MACSEPMIGRWAVRDEGDYDHHVDQLARSLAAVDPDEADEEARQRVAANAARDTAPATYIAGYEDMRRVSRHEAAHADYAVSVGWTISRAILRPDASGACLVEGFGTDYATELRRVVFQLVGLASDLRETSGRWIAQCYDTIAARLKIDSLNERQIGPHLSFEHAAALAVSFVDQRHGAIKNIGLALYDARELDHYAVELFGRAPR